MSGAQSVFAVQSDGADAAFNGIIVELDTAIAEEPAQTGLCNRGRVRLSDIMQFTPGMRPVIGQCHVLRRLFEQAVIASVSVHLQDAVEAAQDVFRVLAQPTGRIGKGNAGRIPPMVCHRGPAPGRILFLCVCAPGPDLARMFHP